MAHEHRPQDEGADLSPATDSGAAAGSASAQESASAKHGTMAIDRALVRELAELLSETGLTEIEVEDGKRKIRVARTISAAAGMQSAPAAQYAPAPAAAIPAPAAVAANAAGTVRSPMVGTVYLSPDPASPSYVTVGQAVKAGDIVLIIEAMKVMNAITAPHAGTVTAILVENAQPVEYDQPMIVIA